jgi:predicted metal-dependent RNase
VTGHGNKKYAKALGKTQNMLLVVDTKENKLRMESKCVYIRGLIIHIL